MSHPIRLSQVRHAIDSSYCYQKNKSECRLKVTLFSPNNKKLLSKRYTTYLLDIYNSKIYFQNMNISIPEEHKILVNIKHDNGTEQQRVIYFDEIENNNGHIFL